jgi:hypothetical protein
LFRAAEYYRVSFCAPSQWRASTYLRVAKLSESRITLDSFYAGGGYSAQFSTPEKLKNGVSYRTAIAVGYLTLSEAHP